MGLANLYNIPGTPETFASWSFSHQAHHRDIIRRIYEVYNTALPEYTLDPVNEGNFRGFLDQHQIMHQQMNQILGLENFDLSQLNIKDRGQFASWIQLNGSNHTRAATILKI